jgi:uncharacterized protein YjbI with pentapeptide repeats
MEALSFVTGSLTVLSSREELTAIMDTLSDQFLCNYDLSGIDCSGMCFDGYRIRNVIFSKYSDSTDEKHTLSRLSFVGACLESVSFAQSRLSRCNFDGSTIQGGDFFFSVMEFCRFRDSIGYALDFRYSQIANCSMSTAVMAMCDFYMADFTGTTAFIDSHFMYCSLTSATFRCNCLTMDNLASTSIKVDNNERGCSKELAELLAAKFKDVHLIQDHIGLYHQFYHIANWNRRNPCGGFSHLNVGEKDNISAESQLFITKEAMQLYSELSGTFTGKGLFKDSNRAYRMAKRKELEYRRLSSRKAFGEKRIREGLVHRLKCAGPLLAKILGYGYKWSVIVSWFIFLVVGYSLYHFFITKVTYAHSLTGSMNNAMGPNQDFIIHLNEFIGSLEPTIGTLLIGFLGFVIANRIRNNS